MTVLAALDYGTVPDWIAGIGSVVTAFLHAKPVPAAPAFITARTQADGVLGGNWPTD